MDPRIGRSSPTCQSALCKCVKPALWRIQTTNADPVAEESHLTADADTGLQFLSTYKGGIQSEMEAGGRAVTRLADAALRIFGNVKGNGLQSGRKILAQKLKGEKIVAWYPTPMQKVDPCYDDPQEKRRILKLERLKRRGKGPPKKGHGKRASKGK